MIEAPGRVFSCVRRNWDETVIMAAFIKVVSSPSPDLTYGDQVILEAFRRSTKELANADIGEIRAYLKQMDEDQIVGIVNNVKGITHEIIYVEMENNDGDTVIADLFPETNHEGTDVILHDVGTGETWEAQLKATDDESYVSDWLEEHQSGEILVTKEIAEKMGLDSTGVENEVLTADVESFIDHIMNDESLWDYLPLMAPVALVPVIWGLMNRLRKGEIQKERFVALLMSATGWKLGKVFLLTASLSVPGVNMGVATALVCKALLTGRQVFVRWEKNELS